jgi:apolipoprotein N-acyltransferase
MHLGFLFGWIVAALVAYWVYKDAGKRGMNALGWAIGTFVLCPIVFVLYLIMRKPVQS